MKKLRNFYIKSYFYRILIIFVILQIMIFVKSFYVQAEEEKRILILNSYNLGVQWTNNINKGLNSILKNNEELDIRYEFLDTRNFKKDIYLQMLYEVYKEKYKKTKFDLIIACDNDVLNFLECYGKDVFGQAPIVFCGVNEFKPSMLKEYKNYTGVVENIDLEGTIKGILKLQPNVKNVVFICDSSTTGKINEKKSKEIVKKFENKRSFYFLEDVNEKEVREEINIRNFGKDTAILNIGQFTSSDGMLLSFEKTENILSKFQFPVYVCWDFLIKDNIMGGKVISGLNQGEVAGTLALKVLNGENPANIPIVTNCPSKYVFNYKELVKNHINTKKLPKNYTMINVPFSFYKTYKKYIYISLAVVAGLIVLIIVLAVNVKRRTDIEKKLIDNYKELNSIYEELAATQSQLKAQCDELKENEEELRESEERYKLAVEGVNDAIWEWDIRNDKFFLSNKWQEIMNYKISNEESFIDIFENTLISEDFKKFMSNLRKHINDYTPYMDVECRVNYKIKEEKWISIKGKVLRDNNGNPLKMAGSITDITERKKANNKIKFLAYHDRLTGLFNRTAFLNHIKEELEFIKRTKSKGAILFLDLDNFKKVNDTLGHVYGDELLKNIANQLDCVLDNGEIVYRLGGDEFLIFRPYIKDSNEAKKLAEDILDIFKKPFKIYEKQIFTSASIGISMYPDDGINENILLKNADIVMYKAKESGKNKYLFYNKNMFSDILRKSQLEEELRNAINNKELQLYYQPQVDTFSGKIKGSEVLLRWKSKKFGQVSPVEFIPLAEKTLLINSIGSWVLKEACLKLKEWLNLGLEPITISVNVSVIQLQEEDFLTTLKNILKETNVEAEYLELEITESVIMECVDENLNILNEIRNLGVKIALDDFGTGYSSLSYLKMLPITKLKLDKSFIDKIHLNKKDKFIVDGIIQLAHKMNLDVIAEGVELKEQVEILRGFHCNKIQGYYFSKPLNEIEFKKFYISFLKC